MSPRWVRYDPIYTRYVSVANMHGFRTLHLLQRVFLNQSLTTAVKTAELIMHIKTAVC